MKKYITIHPPKLSPVDLKTYSEAKISWSAIGSVSPDMAREFAQELLKAADEVEGKEK